MDTHNLILPRTRTWLCSWFIHSHLRETLGLFFTDILLIFRPFKLKCLVFQLPFVSCPILDQTIKLAFRMRRPRQPRIDISLLNMLKWWGSIRIQGPILVIIPKVIRLCPAHPIRDIFAVLAEWPRVYVELIRYFFRWIPTSELYLVSLLPRLVLKKLLYRARVPMLCRELYIY